MSQVLNVTPNGMTVQWTGITNASVQDWADITGWRIASVEWEGTFGAAGSFSLMGSSLPPPPATSSALTQYNATAAGMIAGNLNSCRSIRPVLASGGDGTTNVTCTVQLVKCGAS